MSKPPDSTTFVNPPSDKVAYALRYTAGGVVHDFVIVCDGETVRGYVDGVERPDLLTVGHVGP